MFCPSWIKNSHTMGYPKETGICFNEIEYLFLYVKILVTFIELSAWGNTLDRDVSCIAQNGL